MSSYSQQELLEALRVMRSTQPNILFVLARSKNRNLVVYEGRFQAGSTSTLNKKQPVDVYWMDVDPQYVADNRRNGKLDDRVELNEIERFQAYGLKTEPAKNVENQYMLKLVALPARTFSVYVDGNVPRALIKMTPKGASQSITAQVLAINVNVTETLLLPTVNHIDLIGRDLSTGAIVTERIAGSR